MPSPGWYPDPDQTPGRYRFWDGAAWTARTTTHPGAAGPGGGGAAGGDPEARRRRVGRRSRSLTAGVLAFLLLLTLVGTVVAVRSRDASANRDPGSSATSGPSRSAWDDSSPPTSSPPTTLPSTTTGPPPTTDSRAPTVRPAECEQERPDELDRPDADGRVHGGPLSFRALPSPWTKAAATSRFPLSRDAQQQRLPLPEELPWQASAQVGVAAFDDYPGRHVAAEAMLSCLLTSDFYASVDVTLAGSRGSELTVSGRAASQLDSVLTFSHPQLKTTGSLVRIIVVDTSPVTYWFSAVPREREDLVAAVDRATSSLSAD